MERERFDRLLKKYLDDHLEGGELDEFLRAVNSEAHAGQIRDVLLQYLQQDTLSVHRMGNELSEKIIRKISASQAFTDKSLKLAQERKWFMHVGVAAAVIAVFLGLIFIFRSSLHDAPQHMAELSRGMKLRNDGTDSSRHRLPDGTFVTLYPGSEIVYQQRDGITRQSLLVGKAFFDVMKDPKRPFVVYSGPIVTRVLGTSFWVDQKKSGDVEVEVRSGRVQVFENNLENGLEGNNGSRVILHPNHKTLYRSEKHFFESGIVDHPIQLTRKQQDKNKDGSTSVSYVFQRQNLGSIIHTLEKDFGIDILFERESLSRCLFTGDLSGEDLFSILNILCMTTNARYQINETKILITGNGCE